MPLDPGNAACTAGLSKAYRDALLGDPATQALDNASLKAFCWELAQALASLLNAGPVGGLQPLVSLAAPVASSALVSGTLYLVDTSATFFTQPLPASPADGTRYGWYDARKLWLPSGGNNLTLDGNGHDIDDPNYITIDGRHTPTVTFDRAGETVWTTYSAALSRWISE